MKKITSIKNIFYVSCLLASAPVWSKQTASQFEVYQKNGINFVKKQGLSDAQSSSSMYSEKIDQALLQHDFPLKLNPKNMTAESMKGLNQEELDQVYIRLTSGPIAAGQYKGTVFNRTELSQQLISQIIKPGSAIELAAKTVCQFNRGLHEGVKNVLEDIKSFVGTPLDLTKCLAEMAWGGKHIYSSDDPMGRNPNGEILLRNAIKPALVSLLSPVLGFTVSSDAKSRLTENFLGEKKLMLFPAKVYCGQSLLDHRRESVIIDYSHGKDWKTMYGYDFIDNLDPLGGPGFLNIRDEVRMIKPGLYLGRAYINKIFVLNFVLENVNPVTNDTTDACFNGTTTR